MVNLSNITFRYAGQKVPVFQDFSMQLNEDRIYGLGWCTISCSCLC